MRIIEGGMGEVNTTQKRKSVNKRVRFQVFRLRNLLQRGFHKIIFSAKSKSLTSWSRLRVCMLFKSAILETEKYIVEASKLRNFVTSKLRLCISMVLKSHRIW